MGAAFSLFVLSGLPVILIRIAASTDFVRYAEAREV